MMDIIITGVSESGKTSLKKENAKKRQMALLGSGSPTHFKGMNDKDIEKKIEKKEDIQIIKYYLQLINYLKYYLKFKFHFHSLNFTNKPEVPSYEFILMITKLFQELNNEKIDISPILDNLNIDKVKSADIYFNNKDMIPINARPALYEKIMDEIININEKICNENIFGKENIYLQNEIKESENIEMKEPEEKIFDKENVENITNINNDNKNIEKNEDE